MNVYVYVKLMSLEFEYVAVKVLERKVMEGEAKVAKGFEKLIM